MYYYLDACGKQVGPVDKEMLRKVGITRETLVCQAGWPEWVAAKNVPELADILPDIPPFPSANVLNGQSSQGRPAEQQPSSYLWLGILTTVLCCLPFGIVSIVYASKVDSCWMSGRYDEAMDNSNKAKNWGIAAAATGAAVALLYLLLVATAIAN